jgi:hypothetical protein
MVEIGARTVPVLKTLQLIGISGFYAREKQRLLAGCKDGEGAH